jgi:hypothetical protein
MNHLTAAELVDLLDGQLAPDRARHAESCEMCRAQIDGLRATLLRSAEATVPEPSPLFWDHLSARVREHIAADAPADRRARFSWIRAHRWLMVAGGTAAMVLVTTHWITESDLNLFRHAPQQTVDLLDDAEGEKAWAAVREAAEDIAWEDAQEAGITAPPGSAEDAMTRLTDKERERLITLLEEELKRTGA